MKWPIWLEIFNLGLQCKPLEHEDAGRQGISLNYLLLKQQLLPLENIGSSEMLTSVIVSFAVWNHKGSC